MQSKIDSKRIARNSLMLYFRMLFQMVVFLYTGRVVLSMLGVENYGIYDVVAGLVIMLSFLNNSLTSCSQRFITYAIGKGEVSYLQEVCSASIFVHLMMALIVLLLGETIGLWYVINVMVYPAEKFWEVMTVYQCSLFSGLLLTVSIPYNATIIANEKMNAFALITIMDAVLKLSVAIILGSIEEGWRLVSYALMMLVVAMITRLSYTIYCRYFFPYLRLCRNNNTSIIREMLSFSGWSTFGNTSIALNTQGLNLVLNYFFGPALNAARGVAFQLQMAVTQFISSFQMAVNPQITKAYAQGDLALTNFLVLRCSRLSFMMILFMVIPLYIEAPIFFQVWLGKIPDHSIEIMRLLLLVSVIEAISNPLMVAAAATGKIRKYQIYVGGALMSVLPLSVLVLQFYTVPESVFLILLVVTLITQCIRVVLCSNLFSLNVRVYITDVVARIVLTCAVTFPIPIALSTFLGDASILWLVARTIVYLLWITCMVFMCGLKSDERSFIINKIRNYL